MSPLVSIVLPCLNEEEAVPVVLAKLTALIEKNGLDAEIIVCDNGSTDRSGALARQHGARVVEEPRKGYGSAYLTGFSAASGKYLVMGDIDDTYDFEMIPTFLNALVADGCDFVTGSRYLGNFSQIPFLHRYLGNPLLTRILNVLFGSAYTDAYCGFRAFSRTAYDRIAPLSLGMEFNLELAINASLAKLKIKEIPIDLKSRIGVSKLRTFRDGWRSLRMMLLYCPNKVFLMPGLGLFLVGAVAHFVAVFGFLFQDERLQTALAVMGALCCILGFQFLGLGLHAKTYSWSQRFDEHNQLLAKFYRRFNLEAGVLIGVGALFGGATLLGMIAWRVFKLGLESGLGAWMLLAATLIVLGVQTVFTSLFISSMSIHKRDVGSLV